jgi:hypothetical protein
MTIVATSILPAAITKEGASTCANRMNNEAVETARMPIARTIIGGNDLVDLRVVLSFIQYAVLTEGSNKFIQLDKRYWHR